MKRCVSCGARHRRRDWVCPACGVAPTVLDGVPFFLPDGDSAAQRNDDADYLVEALAAAEQWHFWFQSRRRLILTLLRRYGGGINSVLDVGCGTGFMLEGLRAWRPDLLLAGCEIHQESLETARARVPDAFMFKATADNLPFADEFDAVLALDVIEHIDDDTGAVRGIQAALKPGGLAFVTVPQHPGLWSEVDDFSHHRRRYTRADLIEKVGTAGMDVVRCTSCFALTLPLLVLSRLRRRSGTFDPTAEFRLPWVVNSLLNQLMEIEVRAIRRGMSLPFGGTLLIVARRPLA